MKQVSGKEIVGVAQRLGWMLDRIKGRHEVLVIPVHGNKPLKTGTLRSILRVLDISEADL